MKELKKSASLPSLWNESVNKKLLFKINELSFIIFILYFITHVSPSFRFPSPFYDFIYESIHNTIIYSNHIVNHKRDPCISHSPIPFSFCVFLFVLFFLVCNSYIWIQKKSFSLLFRNLLFLLIISSHLILVLLYLLHIINRNGYSSTRPFYSIE